MAVVAILHHRVKLVAIICINRMDPILQLYGGYGLPQAPTAGPAAEPAALPHIYGWGAPPLGLAPVPAAAPLPVQVPPPPLLGSSFGGKSDGHGGYSTELKSSPFTASIPPVANAAPAAPAGGRLSGFASRSFNTTPRNSNANESTAPVQVPVVLLLVGTGDEVAEGFGDATVITKATTTTAQQTERCDSRRRLL